MSPKKKEARKMKARVYKQQKEEEYSSLNQTANNYVKAPLGDITNVSTDDLRRCHVNDCLTQQQGSNHALLQSVDTIGPGNGNIFVLTFTLHKQYGDRVVPKVVLAQRSMITPRCLSFTVVNNVAHYDNMEQTGSPFSCILQGTTQNS
uniref:Uncharacterized protein n=1 Tax=Oryza punctata TaxID=4537 RepID=A0A0E0KNY6_ORYPU